MTEEGRPAQGLYEYNKEEIEAVLLKLVGHESEYARCIGRLMASDVMESYMGFLDAEWKRKTDPPDMVMAVSVFLPLLASLAMGPFIKDGCRDQAIEAAVTEYRDTLLAVIPDKQINKN